MSSKDRAISLALYYFDRAAGATWNSDNDAEVASMVGHIVDAAKEEMRDDLAEVRNRVRALEIEKPDDRAPMVTIEELVQGGVDPRFALAAGEDPRITRAKAAIGAAGPRFDVLLPPVLLTSMVYDMRRHVGELLGVIYGVSAPGIEQPGDSEPEDYDPGPEVDDEGGMSEYRHRVTGEG